MPKWLTTAALGVTLVAGLHAAPEYGFTGIEFHRLDWDTQNLRIADVNGDGLLDIVVANNARARIDCLIQRAKPEAAAPEQSVEPNEILNDPRFENRPFLAEKRIFSLELGDLNGNGRTDMVFYGDPRELVVVYQDDEGRWGQRRSFDIADGATHQGALTIGDFNGDGRQDIVLLATDGIYFIQQNAAGKLEAPVKESGLPEGAFAVLLRDFDGDKRDDLLYICTSDSAPLCLRFQGPNGRLGPEIRCKAPPIRGLAVGDVDGDGATEPIALQMASGRLVVYKSVVEKGNGSLLEGAFERYAFSSTGAKRPRVLTFAPFNDPKRMDIVVGNPEAAEVEIFSQTREGLWHRMAAFPSLQGVTDMAVLGGTPPALLLLSPEESALGLSSFDANGRLSFPRALPVVGKPVCMTVGDLTGDGKLEVIYASVKDKDRTLRVLDGESFAELRAIPIQDVRADPDGIMLADANQDGRMDILLFTPFQEMRIFKAAEDGNYVDVSRGADYGKGFVQGARLKATGLADVTGDGKAEILLASRSFARALVLDEKDRLQVVDQFNGRSPTSQIIGVSAADLDGNGVTDVVLVDAANRCLTALRRNKTGAYEIAENLSIGPVTMERFIVQDVTGDGASELVLLGQNDFSVLRPGRPRVLLREIASYETPIRNGRLDGISVGDLNSDGTIEFLVSEGTKQTLEILRWDPKERRLARVMNWPVFEAKSFGGGRPVPGMQARSEPREFEIGDVTGDGKVDIVLLIHDRVLVYPQQ